MNQRKKSNSRSVQQQSKERPEKLQSQGEPLKKHGDKLNLSTRDKSEQAEKTVPGRS
jgi:hypothetical protein